MEPAFIHDAEVNFLAERLTEVRREHQQCWTNLMSEVKGLDRARICGFIRINEQRQQQGKIEKNHDYLTRLKRERFGNVIGHHSNIFKIAGIDLSCLEREVLNRGLDFGIPQRTSREEIQTEFEVLYKQLKHYGPTSIEADDICRTTFAGIAGQFLGTPNNMAEFSLRKEHFKTIKSLQNNPEIFITRPDKGKGVVILRRKDYIDKMTTILNNTSKFTRLGPCTSHDSTARIERSLQDMLRELKKKEYQMRSTSEFDPPGLYGLGCVASRRSIKQEFQCGHSFL